MHGFARKLLVALLGTTLLAASARAGSLRQGEITYYYNALTAAALPQVSTQAYGLRHDADQGLVIVTASTGQNRASRNLALSVQGSATTLLGHELKLHFRQVGKPGEQSTLVLFDLRKNTTINFDFTIAPEAGGAPVRLRFTHSYAR